MARSVGNSKYQALGGFYRRIKSRHCARVANKATARKIAVLYYRLMKYGFDYVEKGAGRLRKTIQREHVEELEEKGPAIWDAANSESVIKISYSLIVE